LWSIHTATCFDPMGSSSVWLLKRIKRSIRSRYWK